MNIINWIYTHVEHPELILLIIPAAVFYFFLLRKEFIQIKEDTESKKRRMLVQAIMLISRTIMTLLLLIALAGPYASKEHTIEGDPYITLLVDNSSSMVLYEQVADKLQQELEKKVNVERMTLGSADKSNIGDGILTHLQPRQNIILISDGNNNDGSNLGDVALFAGKMNSTINAIILNPVRDDIGVWVDGPAKTMENIENTFTVNINRVGSNARKQVYLTVTVDGTNVVGENTDATTKEFTQTLSGGYHKIIAQIDSQDYFANNNIFYKTVKAVPQPEILFITEKESPMQTLLQKLYKVSSVQQPPSNIKDYYAVVTNDITGKTADKISEQLNDYIADGNGLLAIGGKNSYDLGEYGKSTFETLLPVFVGAPEKKQGNINIVLLIDISGSTSAEYGSGSALGVEKMLAISVLKDLTAEENLAVIAFNTAAYVISDLSKVYEKVNLEDRIASLKYGGGTLIGVGIIKAISLLDMVSGSKNIVIVSDGKSQGETIVTEASKAAAGKGIKIFTIGVGPQTNEDLMRQIADITNGIYFKADDSSRLKILFGKKDEKEKKPGTKNLIAINSNHFITQGLDLNATVYGYNEITPKSSARLLVTTNSGDPILTIWRLGLGRVAALSTDDGNAWAAELLKKPDSRLITRIINWLIGDPDRKSKEYIEAKDTRINEPTEAIVKSETQPTSKDASFYKIDEDIYSTTIIPKTVGFQTVSTAIFAANYPVEYENLGLSDDLTKVVGSTGGRFFDVKDADKIIEFAKTQARRTINDKEYIIWPWLAVVILLYLTEIFIRRLIKKD